MKGKINQYRGLLKLSHSEKLIAGNHLEFIRDTLVTLAEELNVSRASFWRWNEAENTISCTYLYEFNSKKFQSGEILEKRNYPSYFAAFRKSLLINAPDATTDKRTIEFYNGYLDIHNIKSMLDVQVTVKGELYGLICLEQTEVHRIWNQSDELYLISAASYIAQSYAAMLRKDAEAGRLQSELNYRSLFYDSPIPMWVYDQDTYRFIAVNNSATRQYGYSDKEFLNMSILDIRPKEERDKLQKHLQTDSHEKWQNENWIHQYKNGELIYVNITSDWTLFNGQKMRIVMAQNITNEQKLKIEMQNYIEKLRDFANYASHNLRGPVARLMGLYNILNLENNSEETKKDIIQKMLSTTLEIDSVIHTLNKKI